MDRRAGQRPRQSSSRAHTSLSQWLPSVPLLIRHHSQLRFLHSLCLHQPPAVQLNSGEGLRVSCSDLVSHSGGPAGGWGLQSTLSHTEEGQERRASRSQQTCPRQMERAPQSLGLRLPLWALGRPGIERKDGQTLEEGENDTEWGPC